MASSPWKTLAELIDQACANPGAIRVGNSGSGSHTHFAAVAPNVASGALRVLGVLGSARDPLFPEVPTAQEAGVKMPAMDLWRGIAVPKGTPAVVIARLEKAVEFALSRPEFVSAGRKFGFVPAFMPAAEFGQLVAHDDQLLARQMHALGLSKPR